MGLQFSEQMAGQPEQPLQPAEDAPKTQTQTVLPDDIFDRFGQIVDQRLEQFSRTQQSRSDKQEARIRKEVDNRIAAARQAFGDVTPEQEKQIASVTRSQLQSEQDFSGELPAQGKTPETQAPQTTGTNHIEIAVNNRVNALYQEYGLELDDQDPEAQGIAEITDPFKYTQAVERALEVKKQRLAQTGETPKPPQTNIHTGGGGNTPTNPLANMNDPDQLWGLVRKQK